MKLLVLQGEKFSCHSCTHCCRDWHVELMPGEADRIKKLAWPAGDALHGAAIFTEHNRRTFLAHRADGACVFLNESNGRCRIHEKFGANTKPLGCRLFPFQIAPTFKGEASVTARFDCPTVRKHEGAEHADSLPSLKRYAAEMGLKVSSESADGAFDELTRCMLDRDQILAVADFVTTLLAAFERDDQRAIFIGVLCDWLHGTDVRALDRPALAAVFPRLKEQVEAICVQPARPPGMIHRLAFRTLLSLYLRRDEDVLNKRAGRAGRSLSMTAVVLGGGSFRGLGLKHPDGNLRKARLFHAARTPNDPAALSLHWRMIKVRLGSFQFMGKANHGRNFLEGLRSLALLYPLVMAAAKYSAANRGANSVEAGDVDYAVTAIEHSFGRLPILNEPIARSLHTLLLESNTFAQLARTV